MAGLISARVSIVDGLDLSLHPPGRRFSVVIVAQLMPRPTHLPRRWRERAAWASSIFSAAQVAPVGGLTRKPMLLDMS